MGIGNGVGGMIESIRQYIIRHNLDSTERMQRFFELIRPVIKNPEDYLLRKRKKGEIKI